MLSVFPNLFTYGLFAPFVLRLALAVYVGALAKTTLKTQGEDRRKKIYGIFCAVLAASLLFGLFTQVAALVVLLILALEWRMKKPTGGIFKPENMAVLLAAAIAVSILFSGAGFFAFDLPL